MKKAIIAVLVIGVALGAFWYLSNVKLSFSALEGEIKQVTRGDLIIPITASGTVQPASRTEIKSKASGEIIAIPFNPGDMVKKGDLLIELKRDDEQRNYELRKSEQDKATANLAKAKIFLEQRQKLHPVEVAMAQAKLSGAEARMVQAEANWKHKEGLADDIKTTQEVIVAKSTYDEAVANRDLTKADLERAKLEESNIAAAEQDVKLAQEALTSSATALADADERLRETRILSPVDGMISEVNVNVGQIIQSGKTSLTGGSVLMTIADVRELYVVAEVDEADIGTVRKISPASARPGLDRKETPATMPADIGTPVKITSDAFRDNDKLVEFAGMIERILPEPKARQAIVTYDVKIKLTSENRTLLFLGMQADVEFTAESIKHALLVPQDAIRTGPDGELGVFIPVKKADGTGEEPEFLRLRTGSRNGIVIQILDEDKIKEGQRVYTKLPIKTNKQRKEEEQRDDA
jgi:HlyD family secretion protein